MDSRSLQNQFLTKSLLDALDKGCDDFFFIILKAAFARKLSFAWFTSRRIALDPDSKSTDFHSRNLPGNHSP